MPVPLRSKPSRRTAGLLAPMVAAFLVACVWLDQGMGHAEWAAYREAVTAAPASHVLDAIRYPFAYLYARAPDVQLYSELARLMRGRPADTAFVSEERGRLPPRFTLPYPPADGRWHAPYAEVLVEYPVLAVPFMLAPLSVTQGEAGYGYVFCGAMGLLLVAAIAVALDTARALGVGDDGRRQRAWLACGLMLAQGAIAVQRLDAVTALLIALAVRAAVLRKPATFGVWAGLATASKLVPGLMLPALLAADGRYWLRPADPADRTHARDRGPRGRLARFGAGFLGALVLGIGPMFLFSSHALTDVVAYHAERGLSSESTLGLLLGAWRFLSGTRRPVAVSFGSFNLGGPCADALAWLCGPLSVAAALAVAWTVWRSRDREEGGAAAASVGHGMVVPCAAFASLVLLWLTAKVFSTQYMTWGIPVVLAIPGRLGIRLGWQLLAAMALTQFYVVGHHELVMQGHPLGLLNLGAREAFLIAAAYGCLRTLGGASQGARPT